MEVKHVATHKMIVYLTALVILLIIGIILMEKIITVLLGMENGTSTPYAN